MLGSGSIPMRRTSDHPANPESETAASPTKAAVVFGISRGPGGAEVMFRLGAEQWLVVNVALGMLESRKLRVGQCVLVDPTTAVPSILPADL